MIDEREEEREIGGVAYKSKPVMFSEGLKALLRLTKILTPILAATVRETGLARIAGAAESLGLALTDADVEYFRNLFGTASWYREDSEQGSKWVPLLRNGKADNQEMHFKGRYLEFLRWLIFNIEVNFGGFFDGTPSGAIDLEGLIATVTGKPKAKANEEAPTTPEA